MSNKPCFLGMEFGSTRVKSMLCDENATVLAQGSYTWENQLVDGYWTYDLTAVTVAMQQSYASLAQAYEQAHGSPLTTIDGIGISGMMHGYLAFDREGELLVPFRTWRNTTTEQAAKQLTGLFGFNIPQRWSIAHLYQAILDQEPHVKEIASMTTLAGYVNRLLSSEHKLGIGDASGMFPIDSETKTYDATLVAQFDALMAEQGLPQRLLDLLPAVQVAGEISGRLTPEGAKLLDVTGVLQPGSLMAPPEGDAGTGMVATNSVAKTTGNVSAGTSIFAMVVLERPLATVREEIDMVTTPCGAPVAMVHCNNCSSDIDAFATLYQEFSASMGQDLPKGKVLDAIYRAAVNGDFDCGGILSYNYLSGEPISGFSDGRPLLCRLPDARFSFANLSRSLLYGAIATLALGMTHLSDERVSITKLVGQGGYFKEKGVGQQIMASALSVPVSVMETASEGGAWGMAVLAMYSGSKETISLASFLETRIFANLACTTVQPNEAETLGFAEFLSCYQAGFPIEQAAIDCYS